MTPSRPSKDSLEQVYVPDRRAWRRWLERNHARSPGIWLVYYKKVSDKPRVPYDDAVEEALCFGWIDSVTRSLDEERYLQLFTPRKPRSVWSRANKARVERLIADGRMRPAGLAKVEAAKRDGRWDAHEKVEALVVPPDLRRAFAGRPAARRHWDAFSPSSRRGILGWIESAKRPETRARRVAETVAEAARNRKANFPEEAQPRGPRPAAPRSNPSRSRG